MDKCIQSLLKAGEEVEILIINDGSTKDNTKEIAEKYQREYPTICKAINKENGGHGDAVNYGLANATGKYFKVVDSDDWVDEKMFETVAHLQVPYVLMHTRGLPSDMQKNTDYNNIVQEIIMYFSEKLNTLYRLGVKDVIIDPGFGFAKTLEQNYSLMKNLKDFSTFFKEPLLVGVSRKSMIYNLLNTDPNNALNGTTVLNTYALMNGAKFIRVHDVKENLRAVRMLEAILCPKHM